jgi:hypothetical protein
MNKTTVKTAAQINKPGQKPAAKPGQKPSTSPKR